MSAREKAAALLLAFDDGHHDAEVMSVVAALRAEEAAEREAVVTRLRASAAAYKATSLKLGVDVMMEAACNALECEADAIEAGKHRGAS